MISIDDSLFAQIENDAFLSGTFGLEGNRFSRTAQYLKQYLEHLKTERLDVPEGYEALVNNIASLVDIESEMEKYSTGKPSDVDSLAEQIANKVSKLNEGESVLIPGGWQTMDDGHAMVYQFTRQSGDNYQFTVFNSGAGLEYHAKKSAPHQELYNPTKIWQFNKPDSPKVKLELGYFIGRLLKPTLKVTRHHQMKPMTSETLYNEILPSISHIGGVEKDANATIKAHAYTGGQFSGTCSQRVLHQMLKINAKTDASYQQFIFKFKHYALLDYATLCFANKCPFTPAVADQIHLAIENNLKILNNGLFNAQDTERYLTEMNHIKQSLGQLSFSPQTILKAKEETVLFNIDVLKSSGFRIDTDPFIDKTPEQPVDMVNGRDLLKTMSNALDKINSLYSLEKFMLALPINENGEALFDNTFYQELSSLENFVRFKVLIQRLIVLLTVELNSGPQTAVFNIMALHLATLLADTESVIDVKKGRPSFKPFTDSILGSFINNQKKNPYYATNHPGFDQRFQTLQKRFRHVYYETTEDKYFEYLNKILTTEPLRNKELKDKYEKCYAGSTEDKHRFVREKGIEALYMLTKLEGFNSEAINQHLNFGRYLLHVINPFLEIKFPIENYVEVGYSVKRWYVVTTLPPTWLPLMRQSTGLSKHKYAMQDSPALNALQNDVTSMSLAFEKPDQFSANEIQLRPAKAKQVSEKMELVTQADIEARDYFILRSVPSFQIALTLDYFTQHIDKLADESNQRYIEANLFEPGLLLDAFEGRIFFAQFERLLTTGFHFFSKYGQHTRQSLLFVRLDYLVSRYLALTPSQVGLLRLQNNQEELKKQLLCSTEPDVTYVLQQYLFLTLMTQFELGGDSKGLLVPALSAYFYIKSHTNPSILEDAAHRAHVDVAMDAFKLVISSQPEDVVKQAVQHMINSTPSTQGLETSVGSISKQYLIKDRKDRSIKCRADVMSGRLFEGNLARSGVPLAIQHHPLIKQLGLQHVRECLMNQNETYIVLCQDDTKFELSYTKHSLSVRRSWTIESKKAAYVLQPLTADHRASKANKSLGFVSQNLPKILTDGSMNFWLTDNKPYDNGLLTKDNRPVYLLKNKQFYLLNEQGNETGDYLSQPPPPLLSSFESNQFILTHRHKVSGRGLIKLPRYNLTFEQNGSDLVYTKTGERVIAQPMPIHPTVAGIMLEKAGHTRLMVPVNRFYAVQEGIDRSDFYPVVHDTQGVIADASLKAYWHSQPPLEQPLWDYQNSERLVSFQLKYGEPVADSVADALYLVYIYLATNQTEKAWVTLDDCRTRLGGLTGDPAELQFIAWICNDMPHRLPGSKKEAERKTPPYVGCQLKAMSLLCDFLLADRTFDLNVQRVDDKTANTEYASIEQGRLTDFLKKLPETIYQRFSRYQNMDRHLEYTYTLGAYEKKHLLNYYHDAQPSAPLGALGYAWMTLSREAIEQERDALLARRIVGEHLPHADKKRLNQIEQQLKALKPVIARSTLLERVAIDLQLTKDSIEQEHLSAKTKSVLGAWYFDLPGAKIDATILLKIMNKLSSSTNEHGFIQYFPAYFQIACSTDEALRKDLSYFCMHTLIARRHITLIDQASNITFLCNVLYRVLNNRELFVKTVTSGEAYEIEKITFADLIVKCKPLLVPIIEVYQAKDVYRELSETPVKHEYQAPIPLNASLSIGKGLMTTTITTIGKALEEKGQQRSLYHLVSAYRAYQKWSAEAITRLGETLDSDGVSGEEKADRAYAIEEQAGAVYFAAEQRKKALANDLMGTRGLSDAVCLAAEKEQMRLAQQMEQTWLEALTLANRGPGDPSMAQSWRIARLAKGRATLTKANLMSLYCQADVAQTNQATGLSLEESKRLYALIHKALVEGILGQLSEKISTKLDLAKKTRDENVAAQALELLATEAIPGLNDPSIVVIQHEEKILLRTRQVSALKSLLKQADDGKPFHETVEKIIMGGGKSKVILPILAERKAQGHNLVVIEVPQALLETNYVDLNRTSWRLFGKKAYRFEYNRDTNSSPENLERIYQFFTEAMSTRGYLVTTGESIQSLELKYIEILQLEGEPDETRQKQLCWLDKITNLFRNYADCIIDEAHQGLSINKKLNYTSGEAKSISPELIINATGFFGLIETEFLLNAPLLSIDYDWDVFKVKLARSLVEQPNSPLFLFVNNAITRYGEGVKQALIDYFSGKAGSLPVVVVYATPEEKEALAFFKQEITVLLPQTLPRRVNVNYGASKMSTLTPIERTVAIPYAASNVPSERSRFGNELEAINYATQMMLINGISKALIIEKIIEWQALSSEEFLQQKAPITLDKTPTAVGFSIMTGGLNLNKIDVKNDMEITSIHSKLQFNPTIMFDLLRDKSLTQIKQDSAIIHSDAFNHVDCYRTVQCVSGTPSNHSTYHQRLSHDRTSSLGSDGYILQLLHHKETHVSALDYHTPQSFLTTAINNSKARERVRAIIDVNATFKGAMNVDVAKELTKYIGQNQGLFSHPIKHVLYFNDDQILCAIDVSKPDEPIFLGTSEESELSRRLGSLPGERFTYYDQAHTLGIDIRQASDSHALVLIDEKSTSQAFLQGTMRMRELSLGQTVELIVPTRIQGISREALMKQLVKNEQQALLKDNLFAAKGRMTNLIRRNLLSRIQDRPSEDMQGKIQLAQVFKSFFMTIPSLNLFALYGAINKQEAASVILRQCGDELLAQWRRCLETAGELLDEDEQCRMAQELQGIVDKAIPNCLGYYEGMGDSFSMAVETKKEVHKKIEIDVMSINQCYSPDFKASYERSWAYVDMGKLYSLVKSKSRMAMALTLNRVMGIGDVTPALFSMELMTSINYAETYQGQKEYSGVFLKPVFLIWYSLDYENILRAMIITPQEAPELLAELAKTDTARNNWLSTTDDSLIAGNRKDDILNQTRYQSLREQVRFFNGEFTSLLKQETPLVWLKENPAEKLALFENALMFCRPGSMQGYNQMKIALMQSKVEGFFHMAQHPFEDFTSTDWIALFPKTNPVEAAKYRQLAYAFHYLNQNWMHKDFTIEDLMNQFQLSVNVLSYIKNHFEMMNRLKGLLAGLNNSLITNPLLLALSKQELETLEVFLGMPLKTLYQRFGIEQTKSDVNLDSTQAMAWQLASIQSLIILRAHPALMGQRSSIDTCLVDIAKQTTSVDVLMKLFEVKNPPQELITAVVNRVLIDDVWNSELISKILELEKNFSVQMSLSLAEKCETSQIKSFLAHPTAISLAALRSIVTKQELTNDDFATIFLHELTDEDVIKDIVDHPAFIGVANSLIKHSRVRVELLKKLAISLFDKYNSTVGPNQLAWENALIELFKQAICKDGLKVMTTIMQEHKQQPKSTPRFDSNILQLFKEPALGYVLLNKMIHHETQDKQSIDTCLVDIAKQTTSVDVLMKLFEVENPPQALIEALVNRVLIDGVYNTALISKILDLKKNFSEPYKFTPDKFTALVHKVDTKDQIDTLFAREEMTTKLADILFEKSNCSFKIEHWEWLTENQIITVLDKTTDYGSLQVAITNGKLSRVARDSWLNTMISKQNRDELSLKQNSTDFNKKITVALFGLKLKSCKLSLKATNNKAYNEAASVSFELYNKLNLAFKNYLSQDKPNELPAFQNYCKIEIDKAMPILAVHRGYKKALLDILNFICTGLTGGYYYRKDKTNWRFFKADTDSVKAVKQFEQKIGMDKSVEGPKPGK